MTMNLSDPAQIFAVKTKEYSIMFGGQPSFLSPARTGLGLSLIHI